MDRHSSKSLHSGTSLLTRIPRVSVCVIGFPVAAAAVIFVSACKSIVDHAHYSMAALHSFCIFFFLKNYWQDVWSILLLINDTTTSLCVVKRHMRMDTGKSNHSTVWTFVDHSLIIAGLINKVLPARCPTHCNRSNK